MAKYQFKLYVTGRTPRSLRAIANLHRIAHGLGPECETTVIDVLERPELAEGERVLATPTLVKFLPLPLRRVIGDLSDQEKVMTGLDLPPAAAEGAVP